MVSALQAPLLHQVLDALAHGLLLVTPSGRVVHANRAARACCREGAPVVLAEGQLRLSAPEQPRLLAALLAARRGQWSMLMLRHAAQPMAVGVVPMNVGDDTAQVAALLVLGRDDELSRLALQFFCQAHQLTSAESAVLCALTQGDSPEAIAQGRSVALSTVRSQIVTVREKARAPSMRELLRMVTGLPPVVAALSVDPH
jgi:DNA-binding NarL/FixJ family response regulator